MSVADPKNAVSGVLGTLEKPSRDMCPKAIGRGLDQYPSTNKHVQIEKNDADMIRISDECRIRNWDGKIQFQRTNLGG